MTRPSFVIDASVIIAWYSPEEVNMYANNILDCLENGETAITPQLCCLEVNNVMRILEKRGTLSNLSAEKALTSINNISIKRDHTPIGFEIPLTRSLSCQYGLTIYDACYLELAVRLSLPLATLDQKLLEACKAVGVDIKKSKGI
ncbi:MAG: type II toxin-antitoxin system VapC family toxin [Synergistaceae bacterium]|jgi:predicted nucleic acid-binding protein|nr:type II toxin-antitoxin system VapC family toxin [Synergistaceae bacterium]